MFCFTFLYPRPKNRSFDYEYHRKVHMPLGIGLTDRFLGIRPKMFWIERIDEGVENSEEPYAAIVHLLFEDESDLSALATLTKFPEAAERLVADYANYTEGFPEVRTSRWTLDDEMGVLIDQFN